MSEQVRPSDLVRDTLPGLGALRSWAATLADDSPGHAVRVDGELFGLHLASETSEGKVSLYAAVYLPI